jgi:hypothetical protein
MWDSALLHSCFDDCRAAAMRHALVCTLQRSLSRGVASTEVHFSRGAVSTMQWLHVVVDAIEAVLPTTDWEAAFAASVCFVKFGSAAVSAAHARSVSFSPFSSPILDLPISHCRVRPPCLAVLVLRILLRCLRRCSTYLLWLPGFSFQSPAAFDPRASSST